MDRIQELTRELRVYPLFRNLFYLLQSLMICALILYITMGASKLVSVLLFGGVLISIAFYFSFQRDNERYKSELVQLLESIDQSELLNGLDDEAIGIIEAHTKIDFEMLRMKVESSEIKSMRGSDEKGFTSGKVDKNLGEGERRDAFEGEAAYEGLEGELTLGEKMRQQANEDYAKMSQKRWDEAEANDTDLAEYGVEKLGDLVKTDYFEKNREDGAFAKLVQTDEEDW